MTNTPADGMAASDSPQLSLDELALRRVSLAHGLQPEDEGFSHYFRLSLAEIKEETQQKRLHELAVRERPAQAPARSRPVPSLPAFDAIHERADTFIRRFEAHCTRHNIPADEWVDIFMPLIDAKDYQVLNAADPADRYEWSAISSLFLRQHLVTVRQKRDDFKNSQPAQHDTASTYVRDLQRRLQEWLTAAQIKKKYNALCNFLVQEHFMEQLPRHLRLHLQDKEASNLEDMVATLDKYFELRPDSSLHNLCKERDRISALNNQHKATPRHPNGANRNSRFPASSAGAYVPPAARSMALQDNWRQGPRPEGSPQVTPAPTRRANTPHSLPVTPQMQRQSTPGPDRPNNANRGYSSRGYRPDRTPPSLQSQRSQDHPPNSPSEVCRLHGPRASHTDAQCRRLAAGYRSQGNAENASTASAPQQANALQVLTEEPQDTTAAAVLTMDPEELPPVTCAAISNAPYMPKARVRTCLGTLNTLSVKVLLDSGSDAIFVKTELLQPDQMTGRFMRASTSNGIVNCPVAEIDSFACPYFQGKNILVLGLDNAPYDVLLGPVEGAADFAKPPPAILQQPPLPEEIGLAETSSEDTARASVVTRAQARAETARCQDPDAPTVAPASPLLSTTRADLQLLQQRCATLKKWRQKASAKKEDRTRKNGVLTFLWKNGLLYRQEMCDGQETQQLVIPEQLRPELLKVAHENPLSGHFSIKKTIGRLQRDFFWPQMGSEVTRYCHSCHICQLSNNKRVVKAPLGSPILAAEPFANVSVDIVGPLHPPSSEGHQYVLTMVDQATRYPDALPLKHIDSQTVAQSLLQMFSSVGIPKELTSDNGRQFRSEMFEEFLRALGTNHRLTPVYHAQSNGLVERFNGTLKCMLKKVTQDRPEDWHLYIPSLLFAYRDAPHTATGYSPFELIFGHRVRGPLTVIKECMTAADGGQPEARQLSDYVLQLRERLQETCALARQKLQTAHDKSKTYFDKKTRARTFSPNDQVLIFLPNPKNKLVMTWQGPYHVIRRQGSFTYLVDRNGQTRHYHVNHMRSYHDRSSDSTRNQAMTQEAAGEDADPDDPLPMDAATPGIEGQDPLEHLYAAVAVAFEDPQDPELDATDPSLPEVTEADDLQAISLGDTLTESQRTDLTQLFEEFSPIFSNTPGLTHALEHKIELEHEGPLRLQHSYPIPYALEPALREEINKCLQLRIIEPSQSPYCSPIIAVRKKDGSHRFCLDCRQLNAQTKFDLEPIADAQQIFASLSGARWFSKFDLTSGYWQVPLEESSKQYTAFRTRIGLFQFRVMPFGLVNAPATFSRLMRLVTRGIEDVYCYLDDVLVASKDWESHLRTLQALFQALQDYNLHAKPSKCEVGKEVLSYLGHEIRLGACSPLQDKVEAIKEAQLPKTKKELRSFLGSVGYYQKFVSNFAWLRAPLDQHLLKKEPDRIQWTDTSVEAFHALRKVLLQSPVLQLCNPNQPFTLQTDASNTGIGAVLLQPNCQDPRTLSPVAYASRTLKAPEKAYSTIEKEGLAVYWALQKFHVYLYGRPFTLRTDHRPLLFLNSADKLNPRLKRWAIYMSLYRFHTSHVKGEENSLPDFLSRVQ